VLFWNPNSKLGTASKRGKKEDDVGKCYLTSASAVLDLETLVVSLVLLELNERLKS